MENTNLTRKQQKIFAGNTTITDEQIAVFGSKAQTGTMQFSLDPDTIQNENWGEGWKNATILEEAPFEEDFNAISYVNSYNMAYLLQKGIPEYNENTTYYKGSICMVIDDYSKPTLYYSKTDSNLNHNPTTDTTNWEELSKADTDLGNLTSVGKSYITSLTPPSDISIDLSYPGYGKDIVALDDGYIALQTKFGTNQNYSQLYSKDKAYTIVSAAAGNTTVSGAILMPVSKGETLTCYNQGEILVFKFIYPESKKTS